MSECKHLRFATLHNSGDKTTIGVVCTTCGAHFVPESTASAEYAEFQKAKDEWRALRAAGEVCHAALQTIVRMGKVEMMPDRVVYDMVGCAEHALEQWRKATS